MLQLPLKTIKKCGHSVSHYLDLSPFEVIELGDVFILLLVQVFLYTLHAMVFMRVSSRICVICVEGSFHLVLLSVCC